MQYGEFRTGCFNFPAEREAYSTLSDTGDKIPRRPPPANDAFPVPFILALAAIAIATAAAAAWHI